MSNPFPPIQGPRCEDKPGLSIGIAVGSSTWGRQGFQGWRDGEHGFEHGIYPVRPYKEQF